MAKNNINMPVSTAGIMRYNDEVKSIIILKPGHVIFFAIILFLFLVLLNIYGQGLLH